MISPVSLQRAASGRQGCTVRSVVVRSGFVGVVWGQVFSFAFMLSEQRRGLLVEFGGQLMIG